MGQQSLAKATPPGRIDMLLNVETAASIVSLSTQLSAIRAIDFAAYNCFSAFFAMFWERERPLEPCRFICFPFRFVAAR
jgi:hypothetical protein